jgi:hypothetical protein
MDHRQDYSQAVLVDSPIAYWRLGEASGSVASDASGNENVARYVGGVGQRALGFLRDGIMAVDFNGSDEGVVLPSSLSPNRMSEISVEAWACLDALPSVPGSGWNLVARWETAMLYVQGGDSPRFAFSLYDPAILKFRPTVVSGTSLSAGTTYHVIGTYDRSSLRLYVNGLREGTTFHPGSVNHSLLGGAIASGGWGPTPSPRFDGRIGEVAVYASALTEVRIRTHYRAQA